MDGVSREESPLPQLSGERIVDLCASHCLPSAANRSAQPAQATEDDFNRVETNYINAMGRMAEAEGEARFYSDLRMKLFIDPAELKKQYAAIPCGCGSS